MRISLMTVPVEPVYASPENRQGEDVFVTPEKQADGTIAPRSDGVLPVMPKIAIVSLIKWMERHGYTKDQYDFYDVDMLFPSDAELVDYFNSYKPIVVGLSAVVSVCYAQSRRLAALIRQCCPDAWIVLGGSLTASSNLVLRNTEVDICVVGDGEIPWVDFLDYVKANGRTKNYDLLGKIKGLAFLNDKDELEFTGYAAGIPGNLIPFPDYEILTAGLKNHPEA